MSLDDFPDRCPRCNGRMIVNGMFYQCVKCGFRIAEFTGDAWKRLRDKPSWLK